GEAKEWSCSCKAAAHTHRAHGWRRTRSYRGVSSLVALASVRLAQMAQTGSSPESATSAWSLPRQVTHRRWRSLLERVCPQSGQCLDIFFFFFLDLFFGVYVS